MSLTLKNDQIYGPRIIKYEVHLVACLRPLTPSEEGCTIFDSQAAIVLTLHTFFKELFLDTGLQKILMTLRAVHHQALDNKYDRYYLRNILNDIMSIQKVDIQTFTYPKFLKGKLLEIKDRGCPYVFHRKDFV